ncbi:MAG: type II secretion system major pseudopilin GspG [Planctomycetales bacterium]|nr:type II secretion system major pseudopilin GspG [Planctomycetales bacterium]
MCFERRELRGAGREIKPARSLRERGGFTLVELMVVIVIIGLLAGATTVSVRSYLIRGKRAVAEMDIAKICQALDTYYTVHDKYPATDQGLKVLVEPSDEFPDGLVKKLPQDPWGNPYVYRNPGQNAPYDVICLGADEQEGGEGADQDVTSADIDQ